MTSHTRAIRTLTLWSFAAAMTWFAGTALAQDLHGEALVKAFPNSLNRHAREFHLSGTPTVALGGRFC